MEKASDRVKRFINNLTPKQKKYTILGISISATVLFLILIAIAVAIIVAVTKCKIVGYNCQKGWCLPVTSCFGKAVMGQYPTRAACKDACSSSQPAGGNGLRLRL